MTISTRTRAIRRVVMAAVAAAVFAGAGVAAQQQSPPPQPAHLEQLLATRSCPGCFLVNA